MDRITVEDKNVIFEFDFKRDGIEGVLKVVADEVSLGKLDGEWSVEGSDGTVFMSGPWRAEKEFQFSFKGDWDSLGESESGDEYPSILTVNDSDDGLAGVFASDNGEMATDQIKVDGKKVNLSFTMDIDGTPVPTTIQAKVVDKDTLRGKWTIKGADGEIAASGDWGASRRHSFVMTGNWSVTADLLDGTEYEGTLNITKDGDAFLGSGQTGSSTESTKLNSLKFDGIDLSYSVPYELEGQVGAITVNASTAGADTLEGKWIFTGADGSPLASDAIQIDRK
jgi:hypothetical protein